MSNTLMAPGSRAASETRPRGTSFVGLVGVELRRLWWRRLTKVVLLGVVAFTGLAIYNAYNQSSPETIAQRLDDYRVMLQDFERQRAELPKMIADCKASEQAERARTGDDSLSFGCEQMQQQANQTPTMEDFGLVLPLADTITASLASYAAFVYGFLAVILMGSFIGADYASGSLGTWLTFKPRRVHVALSKLAAAGIGSALIATGGLVLLVLGARMVATLNRPDAGVTLPVVDSPLGSVPELLLRSVAFVVAAGILGAALGLLVRHTAGLVGLLLGYLVVVEGVAVNAFMGGRLTPWAVTPNANAFINKGHEYFAEVCRTVDGDRACMHEMQKLSYTHGWVYLLVLVAVLATAAVLLFRRRDVT
jgi:ABC-2 type transport system permease protein